MHIEIVIPGKTKRNNSVISLLSRFLSFIFPDCTFMHKKNFVADVNFDIISSLILYKQLSMEGAGVYNDTKSIENEFVKMVIANEGIIYKICRIYYSDIEDIKDLYQEIVINLWRGYRKFRKESLISTWLYRVALNTAITYVQKEKRKPASIEFSQHIKDGLAEVEHDDMVERLYHIIDKLTKIERSIIFLYLEGKSHYDIAEITGLSVTNIGTKIQRIKKKMVDMNDNLNK